MKSKSTISYAYLNRTSRNTGCKDALDLWKRFRAYVNWVEENPVLQQKHVHYKGKVIPYYESKFRPFLKTEMLRFMKINPAVWSGWKQNRLELKEIIEDIENVIHEQKLIGGYSNQFNTSITAQDLGLTTKLDVETNNIGFEEFLRSRVNDDEHHAAYEKRRHRRQSG